MLNDSTRALIRKSDNSDTDTKSLNRLVQSLQRKLAGEPVKIMPPKGKAFSSGGGLQVWGFIANQTVQATNAETTREVIDRLLEDFPDAAAEVWGRLEPEPDIVPLSQPEGHDDAAISTTSELSNADRFLFRHEQDVRYVPDTGDYLYWDGRRWLRDSKNRARMRAMMSKCSRWIDADIATTSNDNERSALRKWASASETKPVICNSVELLSTRRRIWVEASKLDTRHEALNCQNGTIDLRTGELRPHDRNDFLTCISPVSYIPNKTASLWDDTINRFIPDPDVRDYVQRLVGYAATGLSSDKVFPICWGVGNNGKGSIFETISKVLGSDYASAISPDAVVNNGRFGQAMERANVKFYGRRMILLEETADGDTLDAGAVKRMASGGDLLEGRRNYQESFNFAPTHSVFLMTNAEPRVNCFDAAMKTRVKFIHFGVQVEPNAKIRRQLESDKNVHEAVLAWIVQGAVKYLHEGLEREPRAIVEATEAFFREQDMLGRFLSECFIVADPHDVKHSELKADIFKRYLEWAEEQGLNHPWSKIRLGRELEKRGFRSIGNKKFGEYEGLNLQRAF